MEIYLKIEDYIYDFQDDLIIVKTITDIKTILEKSNRKKYLNHLPLYRFILL
jgi:hypothetical protein